MSLPFYLLTLELVAGNGEDFSSTAEIGETQTASVKSKGPQTSEEIRNEMPPCEFDHIFVPEFPKGESLLDLPGTALEPIVKVVRGLHRYVNLSRSFCLKLGKLRNPSA